MVLLISSIDSLSIIGGIIKSQRLRPFHTIYSIVILLHSKPVLTLKVCFQDSTIQSISFDAMESSYENSNHANPAVAGINCLPLSCLTTIRGALLIASHNPDNCTQGLSPHRYSKGTYGIHGASHTSLYQRLFARKLSILFWF